MQRPTVIDVSFCIGGKKEGEKMAKDPVCGMFVEEKPESIRYIKDGREYYFCSKQCLDEFTQPEKELRKLKVHVTVSIALTIPIVILSLPHMLHEQFGALFPMGVMHYSNYIMLTLATPLQTAAIIITLILIGRLLETRTKERASYAVRKLLDLQPKMAKVLRQKERRGIQ